MDLELLTVEETAEALRLSGEGLRRMLRLGRVKSVKIGRRYFVSREEVNRIKREGTQPVILAGGRAVPRVDTGFEAE